MDTFDELELIFGKPTKMSLFADEEMAYNAFRQSIIDTPSCTYDKTKLPFDDIRIECLQEKIDEDIHLDDKFSELIFEVIINPLLSYVKRKDVYKEEISNKHTFKLERVGICKARGYYDFYANHFYIMKGSKFVKSFNKSYSPSSSSATRERMIEKSCIDMGNYYIVDKDFKCRTATSAASVLMGKVSHYSYWIDDAGRCLADIYPTRFVVKNANR